MPERPGRAMARLPLHFIWLLDCSGSMEGDEKNQVLNNAVSVSITPMQKAASENPNTQVFVRVITFSNGAQWHLSQPTEVEHFQWTDIAAGGVTDMGRALKMAAEALKIENMPRRGLPPVLALVSDGQPTDDFKGGLKALMEQPWGLKAVRVAIAIGKDANLGVLQEFIGHPELKPLMVHNAQELVRAIKWASTVPLKAASNPATRSRDAARNSTNVQIPAPPPSPTPASATEPW
jgi:uncharacterized protein YegL